jgi:hypothetical protein
MLISAVELPGRRQVAQRDGHAGRRASSPTPSIRRSTSSGVV